MSYDFKYRYVVDELDEISGSLNIIFYDNNINSPTFNAELARASIPIGIVGSSGSSGTSGEIVSPEIMAEQIAEEAHAVGSIWANGEFLRQLEVDLQPYKDMVGQTVYGSSSVPNPIERANIELELQRLLKVNSDPPTYDGEY